MVAMRTLEAKLAVSTLITVAACQAIPQLFRSPTILARGTSAAKIAFLTMFVPGFCISVIVIHNIFSPIRQNIVISLTEVER
jgi:hypothetical protein